MKTFTFKLFGHTFVIRFGKKAKEEIKMKGKKHYDVKVVHPGKYVSTVNEPDCMGSPTFYSCCVEYIESQRGKLSDSTLKGYRNIIDNHLDAIMENVTIDEINENENWIQEAFDREIAKGLSEKTLKGYRSFILKVLAVYSPDLKPEIRVIPWEARPQWVKTKETWE